MRGLYIHIPFCVKKCSYCDFYSLPGRQDLMDSYVQVVLEEARHCANFPLLERGIQGDLDQQNPSQSPFTKGRGINDFDTIYVGGGTPSQLGAENLKKLMDGLVSTLEIDCHCESRYNRGEAISERRGLPAQRLPRRYAPRNDIEATIEVNPESATREFLQAAKDTGFNRISFGVQSLSDDELRSAGRIHTSEQAISAIKLAQEIGFPSISADLIIGLPGQTWSSLHNSLDMLVGFGIQHLSVYCLSLEEDTPLAQNPPSDLPSDDAQAELYDKTREFLKDANFIHYEISNFALPGYECQHNLNYWRGGEYIGLGPSAASHLNGKRFKNKANLDAYLQNPIAQTEYVEELSATDKAAEEAMLRLRLLEEGLATHELANKFGVDSVKGINARLENMAEEGLLIQENTTYRLNPCRIMTSNPIFARVLVGV